MAKFKRMLAIFLVMVMIASALPMQALAAEDDPSLTVTETITGGEVTITFTPSESDSNKSKVEVTGTNESGASVTLNGTSTTDSNSTSDSNGNVTEVVSTTTTLTGTETPADGSVKDGIAVNYQETTTSTTVTDSNGNLASEHVVNSGSETKEWTEEDSGDKPGQTEVSASIALQTGGTGSGTVTTEETVTNADGSVTTTTTTDRTVTTETVKIETTVNDSNTGLVEDEKITLTGPAPVYDYIDGVKQDKGGMFDNQFNNWKGSANAKYENWDMPEDADVRFVGTGEHTVYYSNSVYVVYEKDENGNTVYKDGKPVIKEIWRFDPNEPNSKNQQVTLDGKPTTELPDDIWGLPEYDNSSSAGSNRPTYHALMDSQGNVVYGYCIDNMAPTTNGDWYKVINLEDSDYYASEDAENHVRNIMLNGYLGTSNIPKEDGSYEEGSVESIKEKLLAAIEDGSLKVDKEVKIYEYGADGKQVYDEEGNPKYTLMPVEEVIAGLTAGEAHIATQAAIWSFSNGSVGAQNGKDGHLTVDPDSYLNHKAGNSKPNADILDGVGGARLDILYTWLIGLNDPQESTTIINDQNFIDEMNITVHDKVTEFEGETVQANTDDNADNDVYNTDLNFKLAFIPGANDDLLVCVNYKDFDGKEQTIIRRLAGDKEDYAKVDFDEATGSYVLKGLILSENEDFVFDLRLEGTQYLENGVYVYEGLKGREASQNFVGVAQGTRNVDVSVGVTINFDVNENNHVVAKTTWHNEYDPGETPKTPGETPENPTPRTWTPPQNNRLANNTVEIAEEPVPLAAPVVTGDNTVLWIAFAMMIAFTMVAINIFDKKRHYETF